MSKGNLKACLAVTLPHEGGWSDHSEDPGGATMKGITLATFRRFRPGASKADLRAISNADVERIYDVGFWRPVNGERLPAGLDCAVFDFSVNSGPGRAARYLQAVIGVRQDGKIGPDTLKAAVMAGGKQTIQRLCAKRLSFMQRLKVWNTFKRGWSRRVADVEARSVAMWLAAAGNMAPGSQNSDLRAEANKAGDKATTQQKGAGGVAGAGGATTAADTALNGVDWLLIGGAVVIVVVLATVLILKARHNRERERAYRAVANAA